jgi:two-component system sensor histidine kinase/response regulator
MNIPVILCVDDEALVLEALTEQLQQRIGEAYAIETAENGEEALELLQELLSERREIPIAIVDYLMPGMKGDELLRHIHRQSPQTLTILLTGHANVEAVGNAINTAKLHRYVPKPWEQEDLVVIVNEAIQEFIQAKFIQEHQHALETLNASLEQKVAERTQEIEAKNRLLQAANRELQHFAYVVSHDLRAPLRGISQLASWLMADYQDAFDEKGKEMVDLLIGRVKRLDSLIDGILEYSRIGRVVGAEKPLNLNQLVHEVIDLLAPPAHIQITVANELPVVIGEGVRLKQLFQNLLDNAIKFMDKPQGIITVGCQDKGPYWKFHVADNGPGIAEQYHQKIFELFQTLTPRDQRESTGIGLALVKRIVEVYGGHIWVKSTPGQGSEFCFTLPKKGGQP